VIARLDASRHVGAVEAAIRSLPQGERDVLALIAAGDLSYGEAASALGVPIGTVRSRLSRARSRLRGAAFALEQRSKGKEPKMNNRTPQITASLS
jgi:RNA polymerase sigma factor (sigma-70 family)